MSFAMKVEIIVFGIIAAIIVITSFAITIPQTTQTNSSLPNLGRAPELVGVTGWINSQPLNISGLKGKVVLVDFWTYSCINCIRTLPYLESWHDKYYSSGLVIIGVHTPEFEFEKVPDNVKDAVKRYGIKYAVAQDNNYDTWKAYDNKYWPRKYIIDKEGNIRYDHIGEGGYEETEKVIQELLGKSGNMTNLTHDVNLSLISTPEIYLGYSFTRAPLGNQEGFSPGNVVNYKQANVTEVNTVYLSGEWKNKADKIVAVNNSRLFLVYKAKNVNIVAGGNSTILIFIDKFPSGSAEIGKYMLYNIVSGDNYDLHLLEIYASPGFELYTFTFG